jgi:alkanesulfonate monooxygenase SsuD/methylene tetrahydromethanopterin reductase-like flavin-dependent oxidoreductase (luciferase family)
MSGATRARLGVLDLVPISSGSDAASALTNTIDLAQTAERLGYCRYWFAEHHLNPGVAGTSPAVLIAQVAGETSSIRLGSGGVQSGHRTALSIVEEFGLLDALHPNRIDLGIGRSGGREFLKRMADTARSRGLSNKSPEPTKTSTNGILIPPRPSLAGMVHSPRLALTADLLQQPNAETVQYGELVGTIVALLDGQCRSADGLDPHPVPGTGAGVEVWILGSSAGESAEVAGKLGLRFAANYHVSPSTILEAVDAYRSAFVASAQLDHPYLAVSADVVVGRDDAHAAELASGYGLWVHSIRSGQGAIPFPSPEEARQHQWTDEERALVSDRVDTQFVGSAATVADQLERLRDVTGADELIITTITHRHTDRIESYRLLADEWSLRSEHGDRASSASSLDAKEPSKAAEVH